MAKVKSPLWSLSASGKFGESVRYARQRGQNRAVYKKTPGSVLGLPQRRQASIVSEAARLWRVVSSKGPELSYREYIGNISAENWYFMTDDVLLEWNTETLMTAE